MLKIRSFSIFSDKKSEKQKFDISKIKEIIPNEILLHLEYIHLLGNLAIDFKFGILQIKKILVYEQMKNLLVSPNTPFVYKKSYLRAIFQVNIFSINLF